jgi:hypothetical protein
MASVSSINLERTSMTGSAFADPTVAAFARFLGRSLDQYERVLIDCSLAELNWRPPAPETNSVYIIAVHAMGHLRQGVLGVLGGGSEERDRDAEFRAVATRAGLPPAWAETRDAMQLVLSALPTEALARGYEPRHRGPMTGYELLAMMLRHTAIHEGHIELTRDLARAASPSSAG